MCPCGPLAFDPCPTASRDIPGLAAGGSRVHCPGKSKLWKLENKFGRYVASVTRLTDHARLRRDKTPPCWAKGS